MSGILNEVEIAVYSQFLHLTGHFFCSGHANQIVRLTVEKKDGSIPLVQMFGGGGIPISVRYFLTGASKSISQSLVLGRKAHEFTWRTSPHGNPDLGSDLLVSLLFPGDRKQACQVSAC